MTSWDSLVAQMLKNLPGSKKSSGKGNGNPLQYSCLENRMVRGASVQLSSVSVMSSSLRPQGLQHARLLCPSPTPRACSSSCPLSRCLTETQPTILSSAVPFSCFQPLPASGSFLMSWLFASICKSIGASASVKVLPMSTQDWCPLGWTSWISLLSKGHSRVFSNTTVQKHQFFSAQLSL